MVRIYVYDTDSRQITGEIPLNVEVAGQKYADSFAVDLKTSQDGRFLYCADVANFRVAVIDADRGRVTARCRVGRYPYALTLAGDQLYVANIGLFEYSPVPPPKDKRFDPRGTTIPPFGYPQPPGPGGCRVRGAQHSRPGGSECPGLVFRLGRGCRGSGSPRCLEPPQDRPAHRRAVGQGENGGRQRP